MISAFKLWFRATVVSVCLLTRQGAMAAPQIEIDPPIWNFGAVTNLEELTNNFVVRNKGDAPLTISSVVSSCNACLRVAIERTNIPPGGATLIYSDLDLRSLNGPVTRDILVDSNDPRSPSLDLQLTGLVISSYQIDPPEINLDLSEGEDAMVVEISPLVRLHATLSRVVCADTNIETTLAGATSSGDFVLAVKVAKTLPRGNFVIPLTIVSSDASDPPCHIFAFIRNPPDLELVPSELTFLPQEEPQTQILWIKQHGTGALALMDAVSSSDKYHCEIEPNPGGLNYQIYVTAWHQEIAAGQTNSITLKLADVLNQNRSVTIPITVVKMTPQ